MRARNRWLLAFGAGVAATAVAAIAVGWELDQPITTSIHGHSFDRVVMQRVGDTCTVAFALYFAAPAAGYRDPKPIRNHYRFKARVSLSDQHRVISREFFNRTPGKRVYRWEHDTADEGCWAAKPAKLYYVDVEGCRTKNCPIEPFK